MNPTIIREIQQSIQQIPNWDFYTLPDALNCYAYALGITYPHGNVQFYPGLLESNVDMYTYKHPIQYEEYVSSISIDCRILNLQHRRIKSIHELNYNEHAIAIYHHNKNTIEDCFAAHFVRYDSCMGWSHKPGYFKMPTLIEFNEIMMLNKYFRYRFLGLIAVASN